MYLLAGRGNVAVSDDVQQRASVRSGRLNGSPLLLTVWKLRMFELGETARRSNSSVASRLHLT
jgi:hypothetical protein